MLCAFFHKVDEMYVEAAIGINYCVNTVVRSLFVRQSQQAVVTPVTVDEQRRVEHSSTVKAT